MTLGSESASIEGRFRPLLKTGAERRNVRGVTPRHVDSPLTHHP